jgi:hypothetical protein
MVNGLGFQLGGVLHHLFLVRLDRDNTAILAQGLRIDEQLAILIDFGVLGTDRLDIHCEIPNGNRGLIFFDEDHSASDGDGALQKLGQYGQTLALVALLSVNAQALNLKDFYSFVVSRLIRAQFQDLILMDRSSNHGALQNRIFLVAVFAINVAL